MSVDDEASRRERERHAHAEINGGSSDNPLDLLPGVARIAVSAALHTAEWGARTYVGLLGKAARAVTSPDTAVQVAESARTAAKDFVDSTAVTEEREAIRPAKAPPKNLLHDAGDELMRKARDVRYEEEAHPAYERILGDLAPDEGRILRLLLTSGPQPTVDIRTGGPLGLINSHLIAPGLSMIGARAGVRYVDRVPQYLNNLHRLGLIWFSRETLRDVHRYQVLEAQPDVLDAMHTVRYPKLVRRSIHLTPFGEDFCRVCLKLRPDQLAALPEHSSPLEADRVASPPAE